MTASSVIFIFFQWKISKNKKKPKQWSSLLISWLRNSGKNWFPFFFSTETLPKRKRRIFIKRVTNPFSDRLETGTRSGQVTVQQIARGERLLFCYKNQENWFSANVAKAQCDK
jgi:hypothetical protein